jgi:flagellar basal body rod protein FlgG
MIAAQKLLDMTTSNLANISTNGYKQDRIAFANAMERELSVGNQPIGSIGTGPIEQGSYTDLTPGSIIPTKNPLDLAIDGPKGMFAVQVDPTTIAYTRDGSFSLSADGTLVNKQGYPILDNSLNQIKTTPGQIQLGPDGAVNVNGKTEGIIGVFDSTFSKRGNNLYDANSPATPVRVNLTPQSIEGSNVNSIECMVQMITLNRNFELAQKSIIQQDDLSQQLIHSLQQQG